jgi:hypothetical protein
MSDDPLETRNEFTPETKAKYFGPRSNSRDAAALKKAYPETYARMRREALGNTRRDDLREFLASKQPKPITQEELAARNEFSEAEVNRLLIAESDGSQDNLSKMAKDHAKYDRFIKAALSYGKNVPDRKPRPAEVKPAQPEKFDTPIPENLRVAFNYKNGEMTTRSGLERMTLAFAEIEAKKAVAEQAARDAEALKASGLRRTADGKFERIVVDPGTENAEA